MDANEPHQQIMSTYRQKEERDDQYIFTWDAYITDMLGSGFVYDAAIYYISEEVGPVKVSGTRDFDMSVEEIDQALEGILHPDVAYTQGIRVAGQQYKVTLADGHHGILAKKGLYGCTVCRTFRLLIVATHQENVQPSDCNHLVMSLGDFFRRKAL